LKSTRLAAYELLKKTSYDNAYSNLAVNGLFSADNYSARDKAFISRLYYGVIERQITLDYVVSLYSSKPLQKLDKEVLLVLRMGLYQILYMDSVPDNAAVSEAVNLAKVIGKFSATGFINAVLRNFIRDGKKIKPISDNIKSLSVEYSCPEDLIKMWLSQYDFNDVLAFLKASLEPSKLHIRVNTAKIDTDLLIDKFAEINISAVKSDIIDNCLIVDNIGSVENCSLFKSGFFHVQDLSSQLCCLALNPQPQQRVLDICSAPGGKAFTIAELMNDSGEIIACDLHDKRVNLIKSGLSRLELKSITALQNDAKIYNDSLGRFDKVLCDVPCSGLGVIRNKPEIKYKPLSEISELPEIQYDILCTAAKYLKIGGELIYSTCSLNKHENDNVIDKFLTNNPDYKGISFLDRIGKPFGSYKATIFPEYFGSDGFFISKIVRLR
jgi:16S rRNA (cytosine967-C5)-methyltransferase